MKELRMKVSWFTFSDTLNNTFNFLLTILQILFRGLLKFHFFTVIAITSLYSKTSSDVFLEPRHIRFFWTKEHLVEFELLFKVFRIFTEFNFHFIVLFIKGL